MNVRVYWNTRGCPKIGTKLKKANFLKNVLFLLGKMHILGNVLLKNAYCRQFFQKYQNVLIFAIFCLSAPWGGGDCGWVPTARCPITWPGIPSALPRQSDLNPLRVVYFSCWSRRFSQFHSFSVHFCSKTSVLPPTPRSDLKDFTRSTPLTIEQPNDDRAQWSRNCLPISQIKESRAQMEKIRHQ